MTRREATSASFSSKLPYLVKKFSYKLESDCGSFKIVLSSARTPGWSFRLLLMELIGEGNKPSELTSSFQVAPGAVVLEKRCGFENVY